MVNLPDPDIIEAPETVLVCVAEHFDMTTRGEIPALYQKFFALDDKIAAKADGALYGVSTDQGHNGTFRYGVGRAVSDTGAAQPDGTCQMTLSAGLYAKFRMRTAMTELPAYFDAVYSQWLPASPYQVREGAVFELYPEDSNPENGVMTWEVWAPISPAA